MSKSIRARRAFLPLASAVLACALVASVHAAQPDAKAAPADALLPQAGRYLTDDNWRQPVRPFRIADRPRGTVTPDFARTGSSSAW